MASGIYYFSLVDITSHSNQLAINEAVIMWIVWIILGFSLAIILDYIRKFLWRFEVND